MLNIYFNISFFLSITTFYGSMTLGFGVGRSNNLQLISLEYSVCGMFNVYGMCR
jgi:hypothetical protein